MTQERILIINAGSSSLKIGLFDIAGKCVGRATVESIGGTDCRYSLKYGVLKRISALGKIQDHKEALVKVLGDFNHLGLANEQIKIVGHRIVHGGDFRTPVIMTDQVKARLKSLIPLAPLHQGVNLRTAEQADRLIPSAVHFGAFDSAYFADLPDEAAVYPIPPKVARKYSLRRYGFHGFSHAWSADEAARKLKRPLTSLNLITLHLGAGSSMAAIKRGRPIETSMGVTPFEGLMMATRTGDIDPGLLMILLQDGWSPERITKFISKESGWYGLTGLKDFRDVITLAGWPITGWSGPSAPTQADRTQARLAVDIFVHRVVKYIGGYRALLGRVDGIVFTGAIGTRSSIIRKLIKNKGGILKNDRVIITETDEEGTIATAILKLIA